MGLTTESILGWTRISVLILAMGWAAWMDHKDRRVGNEHWMVWVKPALFLWALDLIAQEADWTIFLTASAVVAYASTSIIARYFKGCCVFGDVMFKEIDNVNKVLSSKNAPKIAIVGGAKVSSKIIILKSLIDSVDELIICGGMAFTFIKALGGQIGDSICEADKVDIANSILEAAEDKGVKIHLPTDVLAAKDFSASAQTQYCDIYKIPEGWQGLDAGKRTIEYFSGVIESAKTLLWNGPLGVFELEPFSHGTRIIGEKIATETKRG